MRADYARERVELAYFRTTHGVQGITAAVGGTLVDERAGFRSLYTGMTRGRAQNTAYVVCEAPSATREVMERALERDRADLGVLAHIRALERSLQRRVGARDIHPPDLPERRVPDRGIEIGI